MLTHARIYVLCYQIRMYIHVRMFGMIMKLNKLAVVTASFHTIKLYFIVLMNSLDISKGFVDVCLAQLGRRCAKLSHHAYCGNLAAGLLAWVHAPKPADMLAGDFYSQHWAVRHVAPHGCRAKPMPGRIVLHGAAHCCHCCKSPRAICPIINAPRSQLDFECCVRVGIIVMLASAR